MPESFSGIRSLRLPADLAALDQAQGFLSRQAHHAGLNAEQANRLALALEEVFVNICHYAYPDSEGSVDLRSWLDGPRFVLEIVDSGKPFDGLSLPSPDTAAELDDRLVGGLGWYLVRQMVSDLSYQRDGDLNRLLLIMNPTTA